MDIYGNEAYNTKQVLERQNEILQKMLEAMEKPENKFTRVMQYFVLIAGALGILHTAELILRWIIGG